MDHLILFDKTTLKGYLSKKTAESKLGEQIKKLTNISNIYEQLKDLDVKYVVLGILEHVGILANNGNTGTLETWNNTLKVLLNLQNNIFIPAKKILILGHLEFKEIHNKLEKLNPTKKKDIAKTRKLVAKMDCIVNYYMYEIVKAGKVPIVIGGGQNNAYGLLKGSALALNQSMQVINFDIKADFNKEAGRHSANAFSYAYSDGFLSKYFIFGMHESQILESNLETLSKLECIEYNTFDSFNRNEIKFKSELKRASDFISDEPFGIEIDCKAIQNTPLNPSGFNLNKVREFVSYLGASKNAQYLHISEAYITQENVNNPVGNIISYLIMDFVKARENI